MMLLVASMLVFRSPVLPIVWRDGNHCTRAPYTVAACFAETDGKFAAFKKFLDRNLGRKPIGADVEIR